MRRWWIALACLAFTACAPSSGAGPVTVLERESAAPATTTTAIAAVVAEPAPAPPTTEAPATTTTTTAPPRPRVVTEQAWVPFATVGGVVLHHPSDLVELVGFHESNNDGARPLEVLSTAVAPVVLQSRERDNPPQTAADIAVAPDHEIRSPVTGTVKRGGTYTLYCKHTDHYLVIEPDDHPGWEVKLLHIGGVTVAKGDHVDAGATVVAPRATQLPFASQIDEVTAPPPWPHVHLEVVDPTIKDRPGPPCP